MPIFNPNHYLKIFWDLTVAFMISAINFIYSIERAFDTELITEENFEGILFLALILVALDGLMTLNLQIYIDGNSVKTRSSILWKYLKRDLYLDILCVVGLIAYHDSKINHSYSDLTFLIIIKIIGNTKRLGQRLKESLVKGNKQFEGFYDMAILGGILLVSGHILACLWHYISYSYMINNPNELCWLFDNNLTDSPWEERYVQSYYWSVTTMLTVGYGDITPKNQGEMWFNVWAMLVGSIIFGYSLNRIGEILKNMGELERNLK
jgi:hypothetical protein